MNLNECLEILKRPNGNWFTPERNVAEKLRALTYVAETVHSNAIPSLIRFLFDGNEQIRNAVYNTIHQLFIKIGSRNDHYESLKWCSINLKQLSFIERHFTYAQQAILFAIATNNSSGFVRERAVQLLAERNSAETIPFIIYRLSDWVTQVRNAAQTAVKALMTPELATALATNLPLIESVSKAERVDLSNTYDTIVRYLLHDNREQILNSWATIPDKARRLLAQRLSQKDAIPLKEIRILIADKHFLVRKLALHHFQQLDETDIDQLLKDKSAEVRLHTLFQLKSRENFKDIVFNFLADESSTIRYLVKYHWQNSGMDFAKHYHENLLNNRHIIGSLIGLREMDAKAYVPTITPFLYHENIRVRKTAFATLQILDAGAAQTYAIKHMDSNIVALRNRAINYLADYPVNEALNHARKQYKEGSVEMRSAMLTLFDKADSLATLADIILATLDNDAEIRKQSVASLIKWQQRAIQRFTTPNQEDLLRARQMFTYAYKEHEQREYFNSNPLIGLDFYLR